MSSSTPSDITLRPVEPDDVLSERFQDRGIGRAAVREAARILFEERGHHRVTIDPAAANARAIRCYESVGFKSVGIMRDYEQAADGTWHDGLLMDLLATSCARRAGRP